MKKTVLFIVTILIASAAFSQTKEKTKDSLIINGTDTIHINPEQEAEFPKESATNKYKSYFWFLVRNLNSDIPKQNGAPKGKYTVIVNFIVNADGSLSDFVIEKDPGYGTAEEVTRVLKLSPKWLPGQQNGRIVKSKHRQAITFAVD